jgi:hypothetical protein
MNIFNHRYLLPLMLGGACLSRAPIKSSEKPLSPVVNSDVSKQSTPIDDPLSCANHDDCEELPYCFLEQCISISPDQSCSLPDGSRMGALYAGNEELNKECFLLIDADGDGIDEMLHITRDLDLGQIRIIITNLETKSTKDFEVSSGNSLFDSPHVSLKVIPATIAGTPLLHLDVPGVEACDSSSYTYYLSYSSSNGIQVAIKETIFDGEMSTIESEVRFNPDGTAEYREHQEIFYQEDTGNPESYDDVDASDDGLPNSLEEEEWLRRCLQDGVYSPCDIPATREDKEASE